MNASDDNEFDIDIRLWVTLLRYVRNSGQFSIPGDLVIFPGQAIKIQDCRSKIGMYAHLNYA